jgi:hypothetical protein
MTINNVNQNVISAEMANDAMFRSLADNMANSPKANASLKGKQLFAFFTSNETHTASDYEKNTYDESKQKSGTYTIEEYQNNPKKSSTSFWSKVDEPKSVRNDATSSEEPTTSSQPTYTRTKEISAFDASDEQPTSVSSQGVYRRPGEKSSSTQSSENQTVSWSKMGAGTLIGGVVGLVLTKSPIGFLWGAAVGAGYTAYTGIKEMLGR